MSVSLFCNICCINQLNTIKPHWLAYIFRQRLNCVLRTGKHLIKCQVETKPCPKQWFDILCYLLYFGCLMNCFVYYRGKLSQKVNVCAVNCIFGGNVQQMFLQSRQKLMEICKCSCIIKFISFLCSSRGCYRQQKASP